MQYAVNAVDKAPYTAPDSSIAQTSPCSLILFLQYDVNDTNQASRAVVLSRQ